MREKHWSLQSFGFVTPQKWPQQALQLKEAPSHHDSDTQSLSLEVEGKHCLAGTFALWLCRRDDFFLSKLCVLLQGSTKALRLWQRQAMLRFWSKSLSGADSWLYHLPSQTRNAATEHINDQIKWPDQKFPAEQVRSTWDECLLQVWPHLNASYMRYGMAEGLHCRVVTEALVPEHVSTRADLMFKWNGQAHPAFLPQEQHCKQKQNMMRWLSVQY